MRNTILSEFDHPAMTYSARTHLQETGRIGRPLAMLIALLLLIAPLPSATAADPTSAVEIVPVIQRHAERVLGGRRGCILVYDLRKRCFTAMVNPSTALDRKFPPGSILKIVTATALLESGKLSSIESVQCQNRIQLAGRDFVCDHGNGHGRVALSAALSRSCSVFFYTKGQRLSVADLREAGRKLGLGSSNPWVGAGRAGCVNGSSRSKDRDGWSTSSRARTLATVGEGAPVAMTPCAVARMMARLATATEGDGFRPGTLRLLRRAMRDAVESGTARMSVVRDVGVAGKTGTAACLSQPVQGEHRTHGWFAGFGPVEHPRYVIVIFLERGDGGGAARLSASIWNKVLSP